LVGGFYYRVAMFLIKALTSEALYDLLKYIGTPKVEHWYTTKQCIRNFLACILMSDGGLRVGELLQLNIGDLWDHKHARPQRSIQLISEKSKLPRLVPLNNRVRDSIKIIWDFGWSKNRRDNPTLPAFTTHKGKLGKPMTSRQLQRIIREAGQAALGYRVTPHMLRHSFATRLLKKNSRGEARTNIRVLQILLGHKNIASTQVYTHPTSEDCQEAVDSLD